MTPAVKLALAYVYATGNLPKHIRLGTYIGARGYMEASDYVVTRRLYNVKAEHLAAVQAHPLAVAHDYLTHHGFTVSRQGQGTSHYVGYDKEGYEALAYRGGGCTVYTLRDSIPYRVARHIECKDTYPPYN